MSHPLSRQLVLASMLYASLSCGVQAVEIRTLVRDQLAPLPFPISNNAVTTVSAAQRQFVVSFNGLAQGRSYRDALAVTYVLDSRRNAWHAAAPVPGGVGRLASSAASVDGLAYVFGGYTVAADGSEKTTASVHAFDPVRGVFRRRANIPLPVDDTISLAYANRFIYLIGGWHDNGNVNLVQRYDTQADSWDEATPLPGESVFGHAGGIVDNQMVLCDGVAIRLSAGGGREFVAHNACFLGIIDVEDSRRIDWRNIEPHPGLPRYRMAAGGIGSINGVLFLGGSENPYNYDGIGYNGEASEPAGVPLVFHLPSRSWRVLPANIPGSMDHRGLVPLEGRWITVGGMVSGPQVTDQVTAYAFH